LHFRFAYSIGQTVLGRQIDRIGTRRELTLSVRSVLTDFILTPLANGFYSFGFLRLLLGAGESANWPAATKAVSEWFPNRSADWQLPCSIAAHRLACNRSLFIVFMDLFPMGWRPAFAVPGCLGFSGSSCGDGYYPPALHPRISDAERQMLAADGLNSELAGNSRLQLRELVGASATWGVIVAKTFTDPVWFLSPTGFPFTWLPKGIDLRNGLLAVGSHLSRRNLGNFFGGGVSGYLIKKGWSLGAAARRSLSSAELA